MASNQGPPAGRAFTLSANVAEFVPNFATPAAQQPQQPEADSSRPRTSLNPSSQEFVPRGLQSSSSTSSSPLNADRPEFIPASLRQQQQQQQELRSEDSVGKQHYDVSDGDNDQGQDQEDTSDYDGRLDYDAVGGHGGDEADAGDLLEHHHDDNLDAEYGGGGGGSGFLSADKLEHLSPEQMVYPSVPAMLAPEPSELSRSSRRGGLLRPPHSFFLSPQLYQEMQWRRACRLQVPPPAVRAQLPPSFGPSGMEDQYHSVLPLERDATPQAQHRLRHQQSLMVQQPPAGHFRGGSGAGKLGHMQALGAAKPLIRTEILLDSPFDFDPSLSELDSSSYRVISLSTGEALLCRRILKSRFPDDRIQHAVAPWLRFSPPGEASSVPSMVGLRECFNCPTWRDGDSVCLIYDYHPDAISFQHKYFGPNGCPPVSDTLIWSYLCQLLTLMSSVHSSGLCCRGMLSPKRVLVCGQNRLRVMGAGLADLLHGPPRRPMQQMQMVDLMCAGRLLLCLATGDPNAPRQVAAALRVVESRFGPSMSRMLSRLLSALQQPPGSVSAALLCSEAGPQLAQECSRLYTHADSMYNELEKEFENGRMLRLLVKLGFVNERPSFQGHARWSETGDRFLLKLLRNFIFHQTNPDGTANVDFGHVVNVLNKLDAGLPQQVVLVSPPVTAPGIGGGMEDSLLVASFQQLRAAVNDAFEALNKDAARGGVPDAPPVNPHIFEHAPRGHM